MYFEVKLYGEAFILGGRGDSGDTDMLKCVLLFVVFVNIFILG